MEIWKTIKSLPNYEVSNHGRIRNNKTKRLMSLNCPSKLYTYVNLYVSPRKTKSCRVHRLVAETFISNPNNYPCVNHINGNKKDNHVDNLEWCSYSQNTLHAYKTGLIKQTKSFIPEVELAISTLIKNKCCSVKDLAKVLNVSYQTIYNIIK